MPLGLPDVPAELKPVLPYLQRAEELKSTEPVVSYWCTYYAAQLGIGLKAKNPDARSFLGALLGKLEENKAATVASNPGAAEAIDSESASAAYCENFALKVFGAADNEDRRGNVTRATAKKFLAAANFLELLKIFEGGLSETDEEKIRYAKWKAADIAKAFREGRKPVPGPAGGLPSPPADTDEPPEPSAHVFGDSPVGTIPSAPHIPPSESAFDLPYVPPIVTPPAADTPPPAPQPTTPEIDAHLHAAPHIALPLSSKIPPTPGSWSTAATPGAGDGLTPGLANPYLDRALSNATIENGDLPGHGVGNANTDALGITPSAPEDHDIIMAPSATPLAPPEFDGVDTSGLPPGFVPQHVVPSLPPPSPTHIPSASSAAAPVHAPTPAYASQAVRATITSIAQSVQDDDEDNVPSLTPQQLSQAQKHCRFAISSLDYDDILQARKELRAALAIIGG